MPKLANIKKLQKERAEVACSVLTNYVNLDSSEEYVDSSVNSNESSDKNFELNDHNQVNSIIEDAEDFQSQEYQDEKNLNKELGGNLNKELDEETKKIHNAIKFVDNVMREKTLFKTEEAHYTAVIYFYRLHLKGQKKMDAAKVVSDMIDGRPWLAKCIRKYANICMKKELIQPDLRERSLLKSLLHENCWLERLMSKWVDPECRIRTYSDLESSKKEHVWVLGANQDGYWDSKKLLEQVRKAVNIFEQTHL
ncbi:3344_t:CDS:2, partial [Cetraspora pellucida]